MRKNFWNRILPLGMVLILCLSMVIFDVRAGFNEADLEIIWLDPEIQEIGRFTENGLAGFKKKGKVGYLNTRGEIIVPAQFDVGHPFTEHNLAAVGKSTSSGTLLGFINQTGEVVVPLKYEWVNDFLDEITAVLEPNSNQLLSFLGNKGEAYFINQKGEKLMAIDANSYSGFGSGYSWRINRDGETQIINKNFQVVRTLSKKYQGGEVSSMFLKDGFAVIKASTGKGVIDTQGREVIPCRYEEIYYANSRLFFSGFITAKKDGKIMLVDKNGQEYSTYDHYSRYKEGLCAVTKGNKSGFIDLNGDEAIACQYEKVWDFGEGLAGFQAGGQKDSAKIGFINKSGQTVIDPAFENVGVFYQGIVPVKKDGRWGLLKHPLKSFRPVNLAVESVVRQTLGKLTGELTEQDWLKITHLDFSGMDLSDVRGIEKAKNLKEINLSFASLADVTGLEELPDLKTLILKNSKLSKLQLAEIRLQLPKVVFQITQVEITEAAVKNWDTEQNTEALIASAQSIIEKAGKKEVIATGNTYVIDKNLTDESARKAEAVKEQLYAKAGQDNKELGKSLDTTIKLSLKKTEPQMTIKVAENVKELKQVDKLIVELEEAISLELSAEQLAQEMSGSGLEIAVEEVKSSSHQIRQVSDGEFTYLNTVTADGFGGSGESIKSYRIKMKKKNAEAKVGLSLKSPDSPYTAIFRKTATGEEVIGGKYDAKTRKLSVKIGEDGEYYVKQNEKNFADIEQLPKTQKEMIKVLASKGVLKGDEKGQFNPKAGISRSELLTILVRLSYVYDDTAVSNFLDVKAGSWYYPFVSSGQKIGVINGYPDNTFKPANPVGAAEMAKMNMMMLVYKKGYHFPKDEYLYLNKIAKGSNIPVWAMGYIAMAEREGMLLKTGSGLYDGTKMMSREEAAEMLYRLWEKM